MMDGIFGFSLGTASSQRDNLLSKAICSSSRRRLAFFSFFFFIISQRLWHRCADGVVVDCDGSRRTCNNNADVPTRRRGGEMLTTSRPTAGLDVPSFYRVFLLLLFCFSSRVRKGLAPFRPSSDGVGGGWVGG